MAQMDLSTLYNRALEAQGRQQQIQQRGQAFQQDMQAAQLQQREAEMGQAAREAQFFVSAMGEVGEDPEALQQGWSMARQALARAGGDVNGLSDVFNPQQFRQIQGLAQYAQRSQGGAGIQFGAQETFKDEEGNFFFATQRRNPRTGAVETAFSPIGGGAAEPVGQLSMVSSLGLTAGQQVEQKGAEAEATARGQAGVEMETKPAIAAAVESAKARAARTTELQDEIIAFEANLPTLQNVVGELSELAQTATYTTSGRAFDAVVRELGFEATEGATAAAKYSAIVANQILPILKATLGSQFTDNERIALEATLGDQSLSPAEKQAQLNAFIEQKIMQLETMRREQALRAGQPSSVAPAPAQGGTGGGSVVNWSDL